MCRRYRIVVTPQPGNAGWDLSLRDGEGEVDRRTMARHVDADIAFPGPAGQATNVVDWLKRIADRELKDTPPFGRYLFDQLIGPDWWARMRPDASPLELELAWAADQIDLHRLPWEMMHDGRNFLAWYDRVAVTRRVLGAAAAAANALPLRVLFVGGSSASDPTIRAGSEYLAALRNCHRGRVPFVTHLLLQASRRDVREAVAWFRPTVVHFISHGDVRPGSGGYLRLAADGAPPEVFAEDLIELLAYNVGGAAVLPQIVVLNACYSAAAPEDDRERAEHVNRPLAVRLVEQGVPIVIGMGGRVADQACRLFALRFYESLVDDGEAIRATAEGRRFGIRHGSDSTRTVEWAMPAVFVAEGVTRLPAWEAMPAAETQWRTRADYFVPADRFPAFCDRLGCWNLYGRLTSPAGVRTAAQLLAVSAEPRTIQRRKQRGQLGRTWLLEEFAAQAVRDGHLPCFLRSDAADPPNRYENLLDRVGAAAAEVRDLFHLNWEWSLVNRLRELPDGSELADGTFPPEVLRAYRENSRRSRDPVVLSTAARCDLLGLLAAARHGRADSDRFHLLLLIDDVHLIRLPALEGLFKHLLGPAGLRSAPEFRVALSYLQDLGYPDVLKQINEGLRSRGAILHALEQFSPPEDHIAYEHFMLNWRRGGQLTPVTVRRSAAKADFLRAFGRRVEGVPSELDLTGSILLEHNLDYPEDGPTLRAANDGDLAAFITIERRWP